MIGAACSYLLDLNIDKYMEAEAVHTGSIYELDEQDAIRFNETLGDEDDDDTESPTKKPQGRLKPWNLLCFGQQFLQQSKGVI